MIFFPYKFIYLCSISLFFFLGEKVVLECLIGAYKGVFWGWRNGNCGMFHANDRFDDAELSSMAKNIVIT